MIQLQYSDIEILIEMEDAGKQYDVILQTVSIKDCIFAMRSFYILL